jgi:hypothetical protein
MMRAILACAAIVLVANVAHGQSRVLDLSGRWWLVEPTAAERALDTLVVTSPDQLLITHTRFGLTIEHPSKPGAHPEAGVFEYGAGASGRIRLPGRGSQVDQQWSVTHIGTQLMISRSTALPSETSVAPIMVARGSMWQLDGPDRLVIEFGEERPGERPKIATRIYVKVGSR